MRALDELREADKARAKDATALAARTRAAKIAAGLCPTCGRQAASGVTCEHCRRQGAAARKKLVAARSSAGICRTCGAVPVTRFVDCLRCRLIRVEAKRARYSGVA